MIKTKKDLTGNTYGYLTVIRQTEDYVFPSGVRTSRWLCKCKCGKEIEVNGCHLKSGHTRSCGCIAVHDLIGKTFGKLLVIERADNILNPSGTTTVCWRCQCECGNETVVRACNLLSGSTISCGCYQKRNDYIERDTYITMFTSKGEPFYVDKEDYDKVKDYCWSNNGNGYIRANTPDGSVYLHQLITDCPKDLVPDHIGGETTRNDNRKNNLRLGTQSQNMQNIPLRSNNTSGCTGVYWDKSRQKWQAQITYNKKVYYLGRFDNYEDAVNARITAEEEYFKEWSYINSQRYYKEEYERE